MEPPLNIRPVGKRCRFLAPVMHSPEAMLIQRRDEILVLREVGGAGMRGWERGVRWQR